MTESSQQSPWYVAGLAFECQQCGRCCAGPEEGFVWVNDLEISQIAAFLGIANEEFRRRHLRRVSGRYTIIEQPRTRDCAFLQPDGLGGKTCTIYSVRPSQCRTWPFWQHNLESPKTWSYAAQRCPGINRGRQFTFDEIQQRLKSTNE